MSEGRRGVRGGGEREGAEGGGAEREGAERGGAEGGGAEGGGAEGGGAEGGGAVGGGAEGGGAAGGGADGEGHVCGLVVSTNNLPRIAPVAHPALPLLIYYYYTITVLHTLSLLSLYHFTPTNSPLPY